MKDRTAAVVISLISAVAFVLHTWLPAWLPIDALGSGLLLLVALPWLRGIIKSVEIPGVGKMELQEAKETALLAKGTADSAQRQLDAFLPYGEVLQPPRQALPELTDYAGLAREYNRIRETERSGEQRTKRMDELFNRMVRVTAVAKPQQIAEWLENADRGHRLLGYAASYASPDRAPIKKLVESVASKEDKPFGHYWGLVALRKAIQTQGPAKLDRSDSEILGGLMKNLPAGSDRSAELDKVLALSGS